MKGYFWTSISRLTWLFFPGIFFLILTWFAFWNITQGKDLMVITLEKRNVYAYFILALLFWAYITWYTCRLAAKAKELIIQNKLEKNLQDFLEKTESRHAAPEEIEKILINYQNDRANELRIWDKFRIHGPRFLAFTCFSILILAFLRLNIPRYHWLGWLTYLALVVSLPYYILLYNLWAKLINTKKDEPVELQKKWVQSIKVTTYTILVLATVVVIISRSVVFLLILMTGIQAGMVLLLLVRRRYLDLRQASFYQNELLQDRLFTAKRTGVKFWGLVWDKEDRAYFIALNILAFFALIVYFSTIFNVWFAVHLGSFPFVILAFGVLLGLINVITVISVLRRLNFHLLFWVLAFLLGNTYEPHAVKLPQKKQTTARFDKRMDLQEYFSQWVEQRRPLLDSSDTYPVYFVLADGGASRSGYWTASVLSRLEDTTNGKFSDHLFCLSGASGGSVGNAAFFALLRERDKIDQLKKDFAARQMDTSRLRNQLAREYLRSDFLTFTLARMLGPDFFGHLLRLKKIDDRAAALAKALEEACPDTAFLYRKMSMTFSEFMTQKNQDHYSLPVLCINTTRMQDGRPAVISNIAIDKYFNARVDVLGLLDETEDMKLSSAVVLGASFPYVSPAGRINSTRNYNDSISRPNYFVDGGYFDNSGAGVVNEMIIAMQAMLNTDTTLSPFKKKLQFYVLHISNDPLNPRPRLEPINALTNDLFAPIKTLMGSYGTQTTVNDLRLSEYMKQLYKDDTHYEKISLYRRFDSRDTVFSMNWVISQYLLDEMKIRTYNNDTLRTLIPGMLRQMHP